jgi:hypothetical protein
MRIFSPLLLPLLLTVGLCGAAHAQFPLPFGGGPPESGILPRCSKAYVKSIEEQIAGMEKLRASGPALVGQICSLIEAGSDILGGELSQATRQQIKDLLGVDVDLRFIKTQCRVGQGNLDREVMSQIGYLKSERMRCNDSI